MHNNRTNCNHCTKYDPVPSALSSADWLSSLDVVSTDNKTNTFHNDIIVCMCGHVHALYTTERTLCIK